MYPLRQGFQTLQPLAAEGCDLVSPSFFAQSADCVLATGNEYDQLRGEKTKDHILGLHKEADSGVTHVR